jgi:hypothetical protein
LQYSEQERKEMLEGGSILLDLDWPSNYIIGTKMYQQPSKESKCSEKGTSSKPSKPCNY